MTAISVPRIEFPSQKPIAPWWHTALLIALFLGLALSGAIFQRHAHANPEVLQRPNVVPLYLSLIAMEWGLFIYVRKGLRRSGTKVGELVGGKWTNARDVLVDAGLAIGLWTSWKLVAMAWDRLRGSDHAASIQTFLPQRALEILLWIGVSISAGICEELVFRGYFQRQFQAYTNSRWIAWFLQAALFGVSHGYQGVQACLRIAAYGGLFGLLAIWRRSLRPGMMAHACTDILSGIFGI